MLIPRLAKTGWLVAVAMTGLLGSSYAQDSSAGPVAAPRMDSRTAAGKQTPEQQMRDADAVLIRVDSASTSVRRQLETARSQRDVVKHLCLNDKLTQIDVAGRSVRDRRDAIRQAATRQDVELANHEYTILMVLRDRVDQLQAEGNQCIGEEAGFVGNTSVSVAVNTNLPGDDPSILVSPIISIPPECVSCTH